VGDHLQGVDKLQKLLAIRSKKRGSIFLIAGETSNKKNFTGCGSKSISFYVNKLPAITRDGRFLPFCVKNEKKFSKSDFFIYGPQFAA
jgi:hypothetical protein